jgi:ferric-dicitrate binding protein FerR (iron transport regulator)
MANNNPDTDRLTSYFNGNYSEEDVKYLRDIFCDKRKEEELENVLKKQWYGVLRGKFPQEKNLEHILYKIHYELNTKSDRPKDKSIFRNFIIWSSRVAAVLLLPLFIYTGLHLYIKNKKSESGWIEINAPSWSRVKFGLPDGSTGWLNSNSSVKYQNDFTNDRKIILDGEAYFDVRTDPEKPFEVSTNEIIVIATGTKFNVASYKDEKNVEVVLEVGRIEVKNQEMTKSLAMNPDELVIYDRATGDLSSHKIQSEKYHAWTEGKLIFRNDPIDVIALRLGRWYNVDVEIEGNNFSDVRLRATFVDENLEEVLYFLKRALPLDYKIIDGGMIGDDETYTRKKILFTTKN